MKKYIKFVVVLRLRNFDFLHIAIPSLLFLVYLYSQIIKMS